MTLKRKITEAENYERPGCLNRSSSLANLGKVLQNEGDDQATTQRERHLALVSPARGALQSNLFTPLRRQRSSSSGTPISPLSLGDSNETFNCSSQSSSPTQHKHNQQNIESKTPLLSSYLSSSHHASTSPLSIPTSAASPSAASPSSPPPLPSSPLSADALLPVFSPLPSDPSEQPEILVGPIIGLVTDSSARILLELDRECEVDCVIYEFGNACVGERRREVFSSYCPRIVQFSGLVSGTRYCVRFEGAKAVFPPTKSGEVENRVAYFRTFDQASSELRVVALACNDLECSHQGTFDMWHRLLTEYVLPDKVDLVLHIGDQVYADPAFEEGLTQLAKGDESRLGWLYQDYYRKTWNEPSVARVLARVQHLMQWDDHEIRNDWGSVEGDDGRGDFTSQRNFRMGLAAREAYWLYQRQLWDDKPDVHPEVECHFHRWGSFGVLVTDNRTSRTFGRSEGDTSYFSQPQWQALRAVLASEKEEEEVGAEDKRENGDSSSNSSNSSNSRNVEAGEEDEDVKNDVMCASSAKGQRGFFEHVNTLLVVATSPIVFLGTSESRYVLGLYPSLRDKLGSALHPAEQISLCRLLDAWKTRILGRELLVVAGDLHFAVESTIYCNQSDPAITSSLTSSHSSLTSFSSPSMSASCSSTCSISSSSSTSLSSPLSSFLSSPLSPVSSSNRRVMFRHIVTSPINNQPASQRVFQAWKKNCECCSKNTITLADTGEPTLSFDHTRFIDNLNFALVTMKPHLIDSSFVLPDSNYWDHHQPSRRRKD